MHKNQKSIKHNAIAKTFLNLLNIFIPLLTGPYLARVLDIQLYGNYNKVNSIVAWFLPIASFGIYNYGIREISQIKNDKKKISDLFSKLFIIGILSTFLALIVYFLYLYLFLNKNDILLYLVLSIQIFSQMFYVEWMNEAFENYSFILYKTLIVKIFHLVSVFLFVKKAEDILPYALVVSLTMLINYIISFIFIKKDIKFNYKSLKGMKSLIKPLLVMFLLVNANMLFTYLDRLFLSLFAENSKMNSDYQLSLSIIMLITQVINSIVIVTIPRLSNYLSTQNTEKYDALLYKSSRIFFMIGIPMCIGMSVFSKPIMFIYGGTNYISASMCLNLLSIRTLLWLIDRVYANQILFVNNKEKNLTKIYIISGIINLGLNLLLVIFNRLNPENLIITTILAESIMLILQNISIKKYTNVKVKVLGNHVFKYLVVSLGFIPIFNFGMKFFNITYVQPFKLTLFTVALVILCIVYYFMLLLLLKDNILIQNINLIRNKYREKLKFRYKENI